MANGCAGLDPAWAHLPAPAPAHTAHAAAAGHCHSSASPWLFPAAAFENEALTCALRASMSSASNASACSSYPTTPSSSSTSYASELMSGGHDAPAPASSAAAPPARMGPKAGRVAKRKPRPSRRPQPTYIVADPADFRRMVQEVTGFPVAPSGVRPHADAAVSEPAAQSWAPTPPQPACVLPTLDTSAFLLDRAVAAPARGPEDKSSSGGGVSPAVAVTAVVVEEEEGDSSVLQELEAMACAPAGFLGEEFPTLESWGII